MGAEDPIIVVPYDPRWPETFERLKARAATALGVLASDVVHVGSTSVPGLAAKPVIDLAVLLRRREDLPAAVDALARLGYVHEGDRGITGREAFKWPQGELRHHLYACAPDCLELRRMLLLRNYLRRHPAARDAYADLKRELARRFRDDREAYTEAKTAFIEETLRQAAADKIGE